MLQETSFTLIWACYRHPSPLREHPYHLDDPLPLYKGKEIRARVPPGKQDKTEKKLMDFLLSKAGRFPEALHGGRGLDAMTF